eukprot:g74431.t1
MIVINIGNFLKSSFINIINNIKDCCVWVTPFKLTQAGRPGSTKKQRVDDDANGRDEENQQSLEHLSQEVERMTKTIEAVNGKLDDHTLHWVQSAMERRLPNILQKAVEQMSQKSLQDLVGKYSQEIVKSVDTLIRPSLLETVKQSVEKSTENALAKTVNEAVEEALKRYNDKEMEAKKESLIGAVIKKMEENLNKGINFVVQTAINQMNVKGKLDGEWVYQEAKGKGAMHLNGSTYIIRHRLDLRPRHSQILRSSRDEVSRAIQDLSPVQYIMQEKC